MKSCIVSLFILLAVTGSWATFLHPFVQFGLQPPQQQFIYPSPQRNIAQEQFLFFPQLRTHLPNPYQSLNYIQPERHPYHYFTPPAAPRFPLYPNYRETYSPVVRYIYQQAPLQSVQSNLDYGERVPEPALKDCNEAIEMQLEPAMIDKQPGEIIIEEITKEEVTNPMSLQSKPETAESVQMINRQSEEQSTNKKATEEEAVNPMSSLSQPEATDSMTTIAKQRVESTSEKLSEEITNPAIFSSEPEQTDQQSVQQEGETIAVETGEETKSDVTSAMNDNTSESTTLA